MMGKIVAFALGHFPGRWWVYAAIAAVIFTAGGYTGQAARRLLDAPKISAAVTKAADAHALQLQAEKDLADYHALQEKARADFNRDLVDNEDAMRVVLGGLARKAKQQEKNAAVEHAQLQKEIDNGRKIPRPAGVPPLSPAIRDYANRLRDLEGPRGAAPSAVTP